MRKPPKLCQAGVCGSYSKNILPHCTSNIQVSHRNFSYSHNSRNNQLARLTAAIEQKNLHDSLQILEEAGFHSEIALFILANSEQGVAL